MTTSRISTPNNKGFFQIEIIFYPNNMKRKKKHCLNSINFFKW